MRNKLPAARQIGIDIDPHVIQHWSDRNDCPCKVICCDAVDWLSSHKLEGAALVYADPPYLSSTRLRSKVYRFDYTEADHVRLLDCLKKQECMVMISGYPNDLYSKALKGWNEVSFKAKTHVDVREERVWFNFAPPKELHDISHLGNDYRQREIIKRRVTRLQKRISELSPPEQFGLLKWLQTSLGGQHEQVS